MDTLLVSEILLHITGAASFLMFANCLQLQCKAGNLNIHHFFILIYFFFSLCVLGDHLAHFSLSFYFGIPFYVFFLSWFS